MDHGAITASAGIQYRLANMNDWLDAHGEALDAMYEGWPLYPPRYECILCGELYNDFEIVAIMGCFTLFCVIVGVVWVLGGFNNSPGDW